jgi:hypothetical protein
MRMAVTRIRIGFYFETVHTCILGSAFLCVTSSEINKSSWSGPFVITSSCNVRDGFNKPIGVWHSRVLFDLMLPVDRMGWDIRCFRLMEGYKSWFIKFPPPKQD